MQFPQKQNLILIFSVVFLLSLFFVKSNDISGYSILNKCYEDCDKGLGTCKALVETSFVLCRNSADINYKACREKEYNGSCVGQKFDTCLKPRLESCFNEWKRELKKCEENGELGLGSCSDNLIKCAEDC